MGAKLKVAGLLVVGAIAGALTTMQLQAMARGTLSPLPLQELQQLAAVFNIVKTDFVEPVDERKLINDAIAGMVSGLDPHSRFFDARSFREFREGTTGRFVGVGIEIGMEDGLVKVVSPIEGSPAFRAGIRSGDLITRIDESPVRGMTMEQAVRRMRGEPDTRVVLTIFRKSENRSFPVTITRAEIRTQSVRARIVEPGFGWIRISQFQDQSVEDFVRRVEELYRQEPNLKGLVLDLRNNGGGLLDGAIAISSAFLPRDAVVVNTRGQLPETRAVFRATPEHYVRRGAADPLRRLPEVARQVPLVVLVNEASASASEIVAGALQDHGRATVLGAQTFGKGSVQTVRPLTPETAIKLTTARYYTPNGRSIQARGIVPDLWIDETAEGNVFGALRLREADQQGHLAGSETPVTDAARERAREQVRRQLEEQAARGAAPRTLPEFGSAEDFPLIQALNHLKGQPVVTSRTMTERQAEAPAQR